MRGSKVRNPIRDGTSSNLRKTARNKKSRIWKKVAEYLMKGRSRRVVVNVGKLSKLTKPGDVVVVPGKVLGTGLLEHEVTIGGYSFSASARDKIIKAGGKAISLEKLAQTYPEGKEVKLIVDY
jgi:large subunit ribosomal protein L18e